jgi:hypothetical protein
MIWTSVIQILSVSQNQCYIQVLQVNYILLQFHFEMIQNSRKQVFLTLWQEQVVGLIGWNKNAVL